MVAERTRQLCKQRENCSVEEQTSGRNCGRAVDDCDPQVVEQATETPQISSNSSILESPIEQTLAVLLPEMTGQLAEVPENASWNRIQRRDRRRIVDDSIPEIEEELAETFKDLSQDRDQQRVTEDVIEIPTVSFAEKIVEVPDTQTRGKMQQGVNSHIQYVVDSVDAEDHIILGKINQMTKHVDVPSLQTVERTVENAQLQLVEKLSETLAISSDILASSGEDPFLKVKSLIMELTDQLQDALELLDKNQLAENDELGFGQACVSEHFPEKRGRNLNPESEVFMTRIFQIWVNHSRSLGPGFKSRQFSGETNRPGQSKQRQVWVRCRRHRRGSEKENPDGDWRGQRRRDLSDQSRKKRDLGECGGDGKRESGRSDSENERRNGQEAKQERQESLEHAIIRE